MGVLEEADAAELLIGNGEDGRRMMADGRCVLREPFFCCIDRMGLIVGEEVADDLRSFGHEKTLAATVFLLFQLTDEFDLILTDCH